MLSYCLISPDFLAGYPYGYFYRRAIKMVEVVRKKHCVIVYDESENRGVAFPSTVSTEFNDFLKDVKETCMSLKYGMLIKPLLYDFSKVHHFNALADFLEGNPDKDHALENDDTAREFHQFFFAHSIPEFSPGKIDFLYLGNYSK